ncbi:MAG: serine hydrolase [Acidobacteria bacterium]|nr:serine hydrolase [Acidobacteriota bacterium]
MAAKGLIPIINGDIPNNFDPPSHVRDQSWDITTISFYKDYMQDNVFTPAGVANAGFAPLPVPINSALAYSFPPAGGWNSGDLQSVAGGAGWRLSVKELLDVMNHVRRKNTIISPTKAQYILERHFGVNGETSTPAGTMYWRKGSWGNNGRHEQCVAFFMPDGVEVAVFVNSRISPSSYSLRKLVGDVYVNSLKG